MSLFFLKEKLSVGKLRGALQTRWCLKDALIICKRQRAGKEGNLQVTPVVSKAGEILTKGAFQAV